MIDALFRNASHRRYHALRREWVLVSPHRTQRPWQGQTEDTAQPATLPYDPTCYLCPGNPRAGGAQTPKYTSTYVFENDYAALKPDLPPASADIGDAGLLRAKVERGVCRVLCFSPRHDLTLAKMALPDIRIVVDEWAAQTEELGARSDISYVQVFENRGAMMGASNPHPHGQIWATESIPNEPTVELAAQNAYLAEHGKCLLCTYTAIELTQQERIIAENDAWVALVPFWAVWPFETLVLPKRHLGSITELTGDERDLFADMLHRVTAGYDRVFDTSFPYSMGLHGRPSDGADHSAWHFHAHFYPPLLRSATIRKFMVGFELLGSPQRDLTPELAAEALRQAFQRAKS
jgi:UDPglucose--hexose-1-phosphate uridylyltransferase